MGFWVRHKGNLTFSSSLRQEMRFTFGKGRTIFILVKVRNIPPGDPLKFVIGSLFDIQGIQKRGTDPAAKAGGHAFIRQVPAELFVMLINDFCFLVSFFLTFNSQPLILIVCSPKIFLEHGAKMTER